jgi:hypothetical protein
LILGKELFMSEHVEDGEDRPTLVKPKLTYSSPKLTVFGTVESLTKGARGRRLDGDGNYTRSAA